MKSTSKMLDDIMARLPIICSIFAVHFVYFLLYLENKGPPTKKKKGTPSSKSKTKHKHQSLPNISKLSVDIGTNLKLEYLLRTHSKNNDRNDCHTQVWMCAFEPDPQDPSKTTSIVATCGGDSICFIDCETGTVIKKYKQTNEVFYCICWTVFDYKDVITGEERSRSMLAAAGVYGNIRIIDPMELVCYDSISYNKKPVDSLLFHPLKYHWLFSKLFISSIYYFLFLTVKSNPGGGQAVSR